MPSKKKDGKSGQQSASWEKPDDILQAVILADSFNYRFLPITLERPRALLPLVNCTLLDYTVDFLISSGVKEIFVFCSYHAEQVINFIKDPQWNLKHSSCTYHTVLSEGCMSLGDAMREIDRQAFIKTDFILVHGDLVSNIKLDKVLKEHKERRGKSKSCVMTMIYKPAAPNHKTRSMEDDVLLAVESSSNRILHWEKTFKKNKFSIPLELFIEHTDVQLRYDLLDCGINVCSPEVPQLFTDNFDFQTKDDFVRGIITNEEVTGNKMHCYVVDDEYGARITNLQMYDSISKDIIRRWAYPVVPDNSVLHSDDTYVYNRHNVYFGPGVLLARDCILEKDAVVGSGSSVGTGSVIRNSVVGKQCVIGYNVIIEDSYIWDGVKIENNCHISKSLLCDNVVVKQNVTIQKGCILSFNVVVGPDIKLRPGVKITLKKVENQDDFGMGELSLDDKNNAGVESYDVDEVGSEGRGYLWTKEVDSDEEDEQELIDLWGHSSVNVSEEESSDESMSAGSPTSSPPPEDTKLFYNEVLDTVRNGIQNKVNPDNLVLEINASKYAYNVTFSELNHAVTKTFLECIFSGFTTYQQDVLKDIKKAVSHFQPLFAHYMKEAEYQKVGLLAAEEFFIQNEAMSPAFQTFLHVMYDREVFDENVILAWFDSPVQTDDPPGNENQEKVREQVSRFITWLQEAEEESDD